MDGLLKFITCGSVDDGKSTLIGHLLYDAKLLFADQENALLLDSKVGSRSGDIDYSLLLDGLMAEREQGITIDVAYRYFSTERRSFIVADTPGHEEYTRNMAVGASFAELAIILVDASKGLLFQTRRHARICALMGIQHFIFAVNKMDLVHFNKEIFLEIKLEIKKLMAEFSFQTLTVIPVSATEGDNITQISSKMPWYQGAALLPYLEEVVIAKPEVEQTFIMPVQRVSRPNADFRGFQGEVVQGTLRVGDRITVLPSREQASVKGLLSAGANTEEISCGEVVTILLDKDIDVSRGCIITNDNSEIITTSRLFRADLLWMDDTELLEGRNYLIKIGSSTISATILKIHARIDVNSGERLSAKHGHKNELLDCDISLAEKVAFTAFHKCQALGRFILIDRVTNMTSACGVIRHPLRRSDNLTWQSMDITREIRAIQLNQKPMTFWFTGLSGSGKSTIANAFEKALIQCGKHTMILDGDNIRMGLNNNLGFSANDRVENIRRIAETAKLMNDAGLIVLVSVIAPFAKDRENARTIIGDAFFEVYIDTSLEECERRDTKGLYAKARAGLIPNFTGISSPYEIPEQPELILSTENKTVEELVTILSGYIDME